MSNECRFDLESIRVADAGRAGNTGSKRRLRLDAIIQHLEAAHEVDCCSNVRDAEFLLCLLYATDAM